MGDMLVKLYEVEADLGLVARLTDEGVRITRALAPDARLIVRFVEEHAGSSWPGESHDRWASECLAAMANHPPTCFVAVEGRQIVGFACYDATAKGFFGPTGVMQTAQGRGIGKALLIATLLAMREDGYGYGIIGWPAPNAVGFYEHTVAAQMIEGSSPGVYGRMIGQE